MSRRKSCRAMSAEYAEMAAKSYHLWRGAYAHVARILRVQHRARARSLLERWAARLDNMAISGVYRAAAGRLSDDDAKGGA